MGSVSVSSSAGASVSSVGADAKKKKAKSLQEIAEERMRKLEETRKKTQTQETKPAA